KKKIDLQFHSEVETLELYFDQEKVEKIFYNLLSNAVKFTAQGGKVHVAVAVGSVSQKQRQTTTATATADFVQISVKDTGIGIPRDKLPYIFDRFYQAETDSTRDFEGTGIGLSLVKELVELHGGTIEVSSQQGWGTEVIVHLPVGRAHPEASGQVLRDDEIVETTEAAPSQKTALMPVEAEEVEETPQESDTLAEVLEPSEAPELILVVEDNPDMRSYIRQYLTQSYQVIEAQNGQEGLEKALATIPDLVICDIMMPKMDGYALCHALKTDEK
ncbi:response regulator, partial [candidate division KSB1 bacterium]|nr:response regulator [candidate division KSB1 bacterium]NIR73412.1 response regulator [candidate division KSB1 bacterium]NIS28403.1 response regulator [candidate division KSB1 bacterium]NIT75283.1 response regulator [candidate division KSB1 bacterium]NIU29131.1 response regulator [candidate division KSB1 bacterium]